MMFFSPFHVDLLRRVHAFTVDCPVIHVEHCRLDCLSDVFHVGHCGLDCSICLSFWALLSRLSV